MLINGKEIEYNPKTSATIQHEINRLSDLDQSLKSDLQKPQTILNPNFTSGALADFEFNNNGFFLGDNKDSIIEDRKTRYELYNEMDRMEFIHRALELVADDGTQQNSDGNVVKINSTEETIKEKLEDLLIKRLDLNTNLWSVFYETAKKGDNFVEVIPDSYEKPRKILRIRYLEPERTEKIEVNGKVLYYKYTALQKKIDLDTGRKEKEEEVEYRLQPWQVVHFKVMEDREFSPYGASLLKPGAKTFRRLSLLEDIMLVYRISRAPERRVFYIDVGNLTPVEAKNFLSKIKNNYRSEPVIDENGNLNTKANVLSVTSDIFIPVREGQQSTRIEPLQGGTALSEVKDIEYFRDKILRTMNIPPAFLGDNADKSRGNLSALDASFARFIERLQKQIVQGINKICALELFFSGYKKEDLANFSIELTPPSNIKEMSEIEVFNQKIGVISQLQNTNLFPNKWILKNVLKLTDKEINDILLYKKIESGQLNTDGTMTLGGAAGAGGMMPGADMTAGIEGGNMPVGGATPEGQIPTGSETVAGAPEMGQAGAAATLTASSIINLYGKEFITENKDSFFEIINYIRENKKETSLEIFEEAKMILNKTLEKKKKNVENGIEYMTVVNELGGISFATDTFKMYEEKGENILTRNKNTGLLVE